MYICQRKSSEISLVYFLLLTVYTRLEIIQFYCCKNLYADYVSKFSLFSVNVCDDILQFK